MLADQLSAIGNLIDRIEDALRKANAGVNNEELALGIKVIKQNWREALFSDADDRSLVRYFNYQLEGISKFSDTLYRNYRDREAINATLQTELLNLIDHLFENYHDYLGLQAKAPVLFQLRWMDHLNDTLHQTIAGITNAAISDQLKMCLLEFLKKIDNPIDDSRLNFEVLYYRERLSSGLSGICTGQMLSEQPIKDFLLAVNFNHLAYFSYLRQDCYLRAAKLTGIDKLTFYQTELSLAKVTPEQCRYQFHPDWPSLKSMWIGFLVEEVAIIERDYQQLELFQSGNGKLALNLSVAQLACLIRMMYEDGCFREQHLQDVFKFFAANFRTKRQEQISANSLSKEYYGIEQVTAAVMRDKFAKMIKWIDQNFFPG